VTIDSRPLLTLAQAAARLQWSVRTVRSRLQAHGIGTVGRGRLARLTEQDLERLIEAERQFVAAPIDPVAPRGTGPRPHAAV